MYSNFCYNFHVAVVADVVVVVVDDDVVVVVASVRKRCADVKLPLGMMEWLITVAH